MGASGTREVRYRVVYQVLGRLRFLSHKELMRAMIRAFRRARIPVAYSQGYHPHPLFSFGPPRSVGMAGTAEQLDVRCTAALSPRELTQAVNESCPEGLRIISAREIGLGAPAISAVVTAATYECEWPEGEEAPEAAVEQLLARGEVVVSRSTGTGSRESEIRRGILELGWEAPRLRMRLSMEPERYVRPQEVLAVLTGWPDEIIRRVVITRTGFEMKAGATPEEYGARDTD